MLDREPKFPIRVLLDDGETIEIESAEALFDQFDSIDSSASEHLWIRDALDRTLRLRMRNGMIELFELD